MITLNAKYLRGFFGDRKLLSIWQFAMVYKKILLFILASFSFLILLYAHYKANNESSRIEDPFETGSVQTHPGNPDDLPRIPQYENVIVDAKNRLNLSKSASLVSENDHRMNDAIWNYAWERCNSKKLEPLFNLQKGKYFTPDLLQNVSSLKCSGEVYFIVIVFSNVGDFKLRDQVRESWAAINNFNGYRIQHYFITPEIVSNDKANYKSIHDTLLAEYEEHQDIIQVNITFSIREKMHAHMAAMEAVQHLCPVARYIAIVESDTFVNTPNIVNMLVSYSEIQENFLMCSMKHNIKPERRKSNPLFMSFHEFKGKMYPSHCGLEHGYIASMRSVKLMLSCYYQMHRHIWYDDLYIGALLPKKLQLNVENFWGGYTSEGMQQYFLDDMSEYLFLTKGDRLHKRLWVKFVQTSLLSLS